MRASNSMMPLSDMLALSITTLCKGVLIGAGSDLPRNSRGRTMHQQLQRCLKLWATSTKQDCYAAGANCRMHHCWMLRFQSIFFCSVPALTSAAVAVQVLEGGLEEAGVPYSYGFAIILLTLLVKAATFPLSKKSVSAWGY